MPRTPAATMSLEELFAQAGEWAVEERQPWRLLQELSKVDLAGGPRPGLEAPRWLGPSMVELVTFLSQHWAQGESFSAIRYLEALGVVCVPHDDTYVLAMVSALGDRWHPEVRTAAIRADDELRETLIWRVFEVEGGGEVSLTNVDKFSRNEATWAQSFRDLVADGTLPRARVLASCLQAMGRDFSAYRVGWFGQLYRSLEPTVEELTAAQGSLRGLLRSPIGATVSFALNGLAVVDKAGRLADESYGTECAAAMGVTAKATVVRAVDIAARVVGRRPDLAGPVAESVGHALEHPHRDVQARAFEVLRTLNAREQVSPRLELLEPSVAREAAKWLGETPPAALASTPEPSSAPETSPALATSPVPYTTPVPYTAPVPYTTPALAAAPYTTPAPFTAADDVSVAERGAALLAGQTDAFAIELFLAAVVSRPGIADELAPLRKQARQVLASPSANDLRRWLAAVVMAAVDESLPGTPATPGAGRPHRHLLEGRLAEIVALLAGRRPAPALLATPTHPAGWLDPGEFVARLTAPRLATVTDDGPQDGGSCGLEHDAPTTTMDGGPAHHDLIAALLRLAPTGRADALTAAAGLTGEVGAAVRYALGGPVDTIHNRSLWLAAARGRGPLDDHPELLRAGLTGGGEGRAATYGLVLEATTARYEDGRTYTWWWPSLTVAPDSGVESADRPTVVAAKRLREVSPPGAEWLPWLATVWPHDGEPFFSRALNDPWLAAGTYPEVTYGTEAALTALSTHPGRLGPVTAATLATGLAAREVRYRALAVDAFLTLVPTGRMPVALLAEMMAAIAVHCPAKRWAAALREAGHEAGRSVVAVLTALLPGLPVGHNGLNALLEALHEESLRVGSMPTDETLRAWLNTVGAGSKGSKTAQAARALLADTEGDRRE